MGLLVPLLRAQNLSRGDIVRAGLRAGWVMAIMCYLSTTNEGNDT